MYVITLAKENVGWRSEYEVSYLSVNEVILSTTKLINKLGEIFN